jgi:hypothetical protein
VRYWTDEYLILCEVANCAKSISIAVCNLQITDKLETLKFYVNMEKAGGRF